VLLLHGEPSWSYLYRKMIPPLVDAGHRCIAPDLIGFGRSDKPAARSDYTYQRHVDWLAATIDAMRRRRRGSAIVVRNHRPIGLVSDRDILAQACGDIDDLRAVPISAVMALCADPLGEDDTVGTALRKMCAHRQWHLPIVCGRGLLVGALDLADLSLWLRDRLTLMTVEAAFT